MKSTRTIFLTLVIGLCLCVRALALEPRAISGAYYNPAQSGHGFSVEALDDGRAIAFWYVYDRDGNPVHLYIDGLLQPIAVSGDLRLSGRAYLASGMHFGSFNPADLLLSQWGDVTLDLTCDGATLRYDANGPAGVNYGTGTMPLRRLAAIQGVDRAEDCSVGSGRSHQVAALAGTYVGNTVVGPNVDKRLVGAVDEQGRIWLTGLERETPVLTLSASRANPGAIAEGAARSNVATEGFPRSAQGRFAMSTRESSGTITFIGIDSPFIDAQGAPALPNLIESMRVTAQSSDTAALRRRLTTASLAGRTFNLGPYSMNLRFDAQGGFCAWLRAAVPQTCDLQGQLRPTSTTSSFFDFTVERVDGPPEAPFKGRGWVLFNGNGTPRRVVMVGATGGEGFGFVGDAVNDP